MAKRSKAKTSRREKAVAELAQDAQISKEASQTPKMSQTGAPNQLRIILGRLSNHFRVVEKDWPLANLTDMLIGSINKGAKLKSDKDTIRCARLLLASPAVPLHIRHSALAHLIRDFHRSKLPLSARLYNIAVPASCITYV